MALIVARLDRDRIADLDRLFDADAGCAWCRCVAWWVPSWDGWGERSAEQNRDLRGELSARGEYDGYLAYQDDEPVGWCQVGPRDRLVKLARQFELDPDPAAWAVTCFAVNPERRRAGVARALLAAVLEDLPARGAERVEAYPRRGATEVGELWNGPEALYLEHGFEVLRDVPPRVVLSRRIESGRTM